MTYFQAKANELQEAIDRVLELHKIDDYNDRCLVCQNHGDYGYPCKTIKAILPEGVCCQNMNVCYDVTCPECGYDYWGCANCGHVDPCTRCEKRKQLDNDQVQ